MSKGGVYGSFVMVKLAKGTSKRYRDKDAKGAAGTSDKKDATSSRSPLVYIKEPIAKFFGFPVISPTDLLKASTKIVKTRINGENRAVRTLTVGGATGASRSVTVRFKRLETIGGKSMASVKIAVPSSHTFGNMVDEIMNSTAAAKVAQIVSYSGRTLTFATPYHPQLAAGGKQKALAAGN
jgi:hypothetical protein